MITTTRKTTRKPRFVSDYLRSLPYRIAFVIAVSFLFGLLVMSWFELTH